MIDILIFDTRDFRDYELNYAFIKYILIIHKYIYNMLYFDICDIF